ncbi:ATP-binding protein [Flavobacterium gawalongense]|uniref:ATP-binding protein n=1 Tax=Flavobacterium gawalongense TaxID=2594432 RepID=A0A553BLI4_9FLAO|nr:ATP-binding protein [Flavobacterium gawalongense]TRX00806.1 ATP-binding protein [Flavobacterium gawalongense]TRX05106.1 ATP-binding protein [Flavobacterium gawalongense]TRX09114.1 ATP-binding protein [Flavobacterium gawalongense]TRX10249.1 ATP-binding protein [Flavobacterium gawalongense]TRX27083.1 ATP-binding protein [Flavobacterium gawalongense]
MNRLLLNELVVWKNSKNRKPLIIQGARQVGKTWLMKEFGKREFEQVVYLNFESSSRLSHLFSVDFNIERIIAILEIETNQKIIPETTLLIFDEIQEVEKGLTALKYFQEQAPQYYIVAAGSLLGISLQKNNSFPVGKVDFMKLYPLSFMEFLENSGEQRLAEQMENKNWDVISSFHEKLTDELRLYYFIGGMPEVVANYLENKNLETVRTLQQKIVIGYENDFAKYAPNEIVPKIKLVWNSLISQLAKENRKFIYGQIKKGTRAKDFEMAINWLVDAGLVLKVNRIEKPIMPLNAYADFDAFKLFLVDIGLLNAIGNLDKKILLEKNSILTEYKGALTEQYVCQQLKIKTDIYYWVAPNATAEIDFVLQDQNEIIPVEVKAEENLKSKSLKVFVDKFENKNAIRTSMSKFRTENWLTNVPLYAIDGIVS